MLPQKMMGWKLLPYSSRVRPSFSVHSTPLPSIISIQRLEEEEKEEEKKEEEETRLREYRSVT